MTTSGGKLLVRGSLALLPLVIGLAAWGWWAGFVALNETRDELARLRERRAALAQTNQELRRELAGLQRHREASARAAREVLHVAAPDEIVVILPSPTPDPGR